MGNDGTKDDSIKDDATPREAPLSAVAVGNGEECEGFSPHAPIQSIQDESPLEKPKSLQTSAKKKLAKKLAAQQSAPKQSEFIRAENEDDDGYDPYSDRRPEVEPLFERDPWM
ncbi:hypothetical protein [Lancefieldella rimae]|uniref:hypothetical protein n=1 Tax=Lancefieldella rimae TaxID=1383 RepID=UPI003A91606F